MQLRQRPYHLFLFTGFALVVVSLLMDKNETVDFHVHDTVFVIAQGHLFWFLALLVWVFWILYFMTSRLLYSKALTWIHILVTVLTMTTLLFFLFSRKGDSLSQPNGVLDYARWNEFSRYMRWLHYTLVFMLLGQIIFVVNLLAGGIKRLALYGKRESN